MKEKFYVVKTEMNFSKIVLVPVEAVEDLNEALHCVANAVECCEVMVLTEEADCCDNCIGIEEWDSDKEIPYQIVKPYED